MLFIVQVNFLKAVDKSLRKALKIDAEKGSLIARCFDYDKNSNTVMLEVYVMFIYE